MSINAFERFRLAIQLRPGKLNQAALTFYNRGQCHALAMALREAKPIWELIGDFAPHHSDDVPMHVLVRRPEGVLLDMNYVIYGRVELWGSDQRRVSEVGIWELVRQGRLAEPNLELARSFVGPILDRCRDVPP
jgi:hypothetical protein